MRLESKKKVEVINFLDNLIKELDEINNEDYILKTDLNDKNILNKFELELEIEEMLLGCSDYEKEQFLKF